MYDADWHKNPETQADLERDGYAFHPEIKARIRHKQIEKEANKPWSVNPYQLKPEELRFVTSVIKSGKYPEDDRRDIEHRVYSLGISEARKYFYKEV